VEKTPIQSKSFIAAGYHLATMTMELEHKNGNLYEYYKVPPEKFKGLVESENVDSYFFNNIVDRYNWARQL